MAFIIDENAFELLHNYLEALKQKFSNEKEREEILGDIEARLAEMLHAKLDGKREVVNADDVQSVMAVMGKPEDIAGETTTTESSSGNSSSSQSASTSSEPIKKRLFRDADDAKIGGVISGLCHYFGVSDPVWMRILAIILIFPTSGAVILIYFLLLVIVPKAMTAAEKLQMKGEPVNINTIEKEVKEAATRLHDSVQTTVSSGNFFQRLGDGIGSVVKVFFKIFSVFIIIISICALIGTLITFVIFSVFGNSAYDSLTHLLVDSSSLITIFSIGFLLFMAAPLVAFIYLSLRVLLGQQSRVRSLKWILLFAWITGIGMLFYSILKTGLNFRTSAVKKETISLMQPANGTMFVQIADSSGGMWKKIRIGDNDEDEEGAGIWIDGENMEGLQSLKIGKPDLELIASENDSFYLVKSVSSQGKDIRDAYNKAGDVMYSFAQNDTVLNLKKYFEIPKSGKWRAQDMKLRIAIPNGKMLHCSENIDALNAIVKGNDAYDETLFANKLWTNENGKIKCLNCGWENSDDEKGDSIIKKAEKKIEVIEKKIKKSGKDDANEDF